MAPPRAASTDASVTNEAEPQTSHGGPRSLMGLPRRLMVAILVWFVACVSAVSEWLITLIPDPLERRIQSANLAALVTGTDANLMGDGMDFKRLLVFPLTLVGIIISMTIFANFLPTIFGSAADIVAFFSNSTTTIGNDTADALLPTFGLLLAFIYVFAILGLAIGGSGILAYKSYKYSFG